MQIFFKNIKLSCLLLLFVMVGIYISCHSLGTSKSLTERLKEQENITSMQRFWRDKRTSPYIDRAQRFIAQDRYEEALVEYNAVLTADPGNLLVAFDRLKIMVEISSHKVVLQAANDLLQHVPDGGKILTIRAYTRLKTGDRSGARDDFQSALKDQSLPSDEAASIMAELVSFFVQEEDYDQAEELCRTLINDYPEKSEYRLVYADMLSRSGSLEQADEQWQKASTLTSDPDLLRHIALSRLEIQTMLGEKKSKLAKNKGIETLFLGAPLMQRQRYLLLRAKAEIGFDELQVDICLLQAMSEAEEHQHELTVAERQVLYFQLGNGAFDLGRYELALTSYERLLEDFQDPITQVIAAKAAWYAGKYLRVVELLKDQLTVSAVPPPKLETSLLLCSAYERLGNQGSALSCFDFVMERYTNVDTVPAKAAQVAADAGLMELQVDHLRKSYDHKPSAKLAMDIGYLYDHIKKPDMALQWLKRADDLELDFNTGLALAQILLTTKSYPAVISHTKELLARPSIRADEVAQVYSIRAQALLAEKRYDEAAESWAIALARSQRSDFGLHRITALRLDGQVKRAMALIKTVSPNNDQERLAWLDEKATIEQSLQQHDEALLTVRQALEIAPDATRYLWVSMLAMEVGELAEAELACGQTLRLAPDNLMARRQEIYILEAQGKTAEAAERMASLLPHLPIDYRFSRSLAYFHEQLNHNSNALTNYTQAIDQAWIEIQNGDKDELLQEITDMQNQVAELSKKFSSTLSMGFGLSDSKSSSPTWNNSSESSTDTYSIAEPANRPSEFGYNNGRISEVNGRIAWLDDDSFTGEDESPFQGALGARIKPPRRYNLVMAIESLFSLENVNSNDVPVRLAHSYTDTPWQKYHREGSHSGDRYIHTFTEAGVGMTGLSDYLFNIHGRYGVSSRLDPDLYLSPFLYGTLSGYRGTSGSENRAETGVGLALDLLSEHDSNLGYKKKIDVVFQLGVDIDEGLEESGFKGFIGLQFSGF